MKMLTREPHFSVVKFYMGLSKGLPQKRSKDFKPATRDVVKAGLGWSRSLEATIHVVLQVSVLGQSQNVQNLHNIACYENVKANLFILAVNRIKTDNAFKGTST